MSDRQPLLRVKELRQHFPVRGGVLGRIQNVVKAVDGITFDVYPGETLSIVGESGCGKSTTGRSVLRLQEPTSGEVYFDGDNLLELPRSALRHRRRDMQIIFQDPYSSFNPRQTISQLLNEAMSIQNVVPKQRRRERVVELLEMVGLKAEHVDRYPHEFSGGQRQRIAIARALSVEPKLIVCDEAVSSLDVSVQAQVINLLKKLQRELGLTYIFVAHDLGVVRHISDRIIVMYLGQIAEIGDTRTIFRNPQHPYTRALLSSIPIPDPKQRSRPVPLVGDVPSPINPPAGCPFHTRCPFAMERCAAEKPAQHLLSDAQSVACHLVENGPVDYETLPMTVRGEG
ncbi:MAG: dipeptide ABC transporter ATP-binding protein [Spirochaetaceae bacterium]|nr:MAG: dipeptide ABC transporter ATP-binding protein [Spirochaetaceae bacterium]